jgi:N-methylhydantoinase A
MTRTLAVDVGGTFTDVVLWDGTDLATAKVPSTPDDQSRGVVAGARAVTDGADRFLHGTTVATNALLERTGPRTALITSPGFEDVLEIGRQDRPSLYDQDVERPEALVPRNRRLAAGDLDETVLAGVDSVAVSLLYSYQDPSAESAVRTAVHAIRPDLPVSISSEVVPEFREFERASTTVLNAYVMPVMARYLTRLTKASAAAGLPERVLVMRSSGGLMSASGVARHPASALLSGPAGGVMAATELGRALGYDHLISFDMGGTSTDVCRIDDGRPELTYQRDVAGYPCRLPSVAIHTVGAGGGSIGWVDPGGALRVGPRSAGADPGPAAYGHGGVDATVTDANLVLGLFDRSARFGSNLVLAPDAAHGALARLAEPLGLSVAEAAAGMVEVVEEVMAGALRRVSIEQGADPRRAALVAFGGAGGLHGTALARLLDMAGVLVPLHAGVFSALGLLLSPPRQDWAHTVMTTDGLEVDIMLRTFEQAAEEQLRSDGVEPVEVRHSVDVRYVGQSHELNVDYSPGEGWDVLSGRFHQLHAERNGFAREDDGVEAVTIRVDAIGAPALTLADLPELRPAGEPRRPARPVFVEGATMEAEVWWRPALAPGAEVVGPAVIEEPEATTFLHPGDRAVVHESGALKVEW